MSRHLRLAHFSPLPPARTGIADYSAELLPHLGRLAEVTLFSEQYDALDGTDLAAFPAFPVAAFGAQRWEHDLAFYHMGNSLYHVEIARSLARYPGIMVLHDFGLHQLCAGQSLAGGKSALYRREMAYALGARGLSWAREVEMGMCEPPHFEVALNDRYLEVALGVLVHSRYARDLARQRVPWQEIGVVPAPIGLAQAASFRHRLDGCRLHLDSELRQIRRTQPVGEALTRERHGERVERRGVAHFPKLRLRHVEGLQHRLAGFLNDNH